MSLTTLQEQYPNCGQQLISGFLKSLVYTFRDIGYVKVFCGLTL